MKIVEFRRHSIREKPSPHLTQEGVNLAREVGKEMGDFNRVISSTAPRAIETAVAMGYAIDETYDEISQTPESLEEEIEWGISFPQYAEVIQKEGKTAEYSKRMAEFIKSLVLELPDKGSILIMSHGGLIEICVIGCLPNIDYNFWGKPLDTCEGVRLAFDGEKFVSAEILRKKEEEE
jgi:broad specificity phosphatase PhoE